jgi:hypothetical protein
MSREQKTGQNHKINIVNEYFQGGEQFKYLGTILTNQNPIHEEIKSRLNSGNACCHSVQNLLSSSLLNNTIKIKICRTVILPAVLCGSENWSVISREECRLRVCENSVLMKIFRPKREEVTGGWRKLRNEPFYDLCSSPNIVLACNKEGWGGRALWLVRERGVVHIGFWCVNLEERVHLEELRIGGRIIPKL